VKINSSRFVFLRFFVVVLCMSLFVSLTASMGVASFDTPFMAGTDQTDVPKDAVHIQTADQLANIGGAQSVGRYFVLDNDIVLKDEWVPIDDFRGVFDGQGYSINNLYVLASSHRQFAGLFGQINAVDGIVIKNVGVNINVNGLTATVSPVSYEGVVDGLAICGTDVVTVENSYGIVDDVHVCIFPYGGAAAGGLVGYAEVVSVENCYVTGDMAAISSSGGCAAGGLVGYSREIVSVENCYVVGDVTATCPTDFGSACAGGLVGTIIGFGTVGHSYAIQVM